MSLFYNIMRHIIEADGNLDILSACNNYNIEDQQCHDSKANNSNLFGVKRRPESVEVYMYAPQSSASYEGADPLSHLPQIVLNKVELARIYQNPHDRESLVEAFGSIPKHCIQLEDSDELNPLIESILETSKTLMGMIQSFNVPWPSWLPDWTFPLSRSCAISNRVPVCSTRVWFASVAQVAKDQFGFIDKEEGLTPGSDWDDIKSWYRRTTEPSSLYENEDAFEKACFKLLTLGRIKNGEEYKCSPEVFNLSSQYRKDETNLGNDSKKAASTSLEHLKPPNDWYPLDHSMESFLWEFTIWPSRPFVTEQGHLGRGPLSSKEEDLICIFPGGKSPYILRDAGKNDYYFLGECYVEGVMEGEGLRPPITELFKFCAICCVTPYRYLKKRSQFWFQTAPYEVALSYDQ
ncbi:hypothetical protein BKA61DRAFT_581073 [Leptodontidium sp. MPI-SDFR-AT-0119]|nr:hypothetical protein BKA61DRAFT_581073 [Leptodontidium sp. MPI-SDFR-AT-0119]